MAKKAKQEIKNTKIHVTFCDSRFDPGFVQLSFCEDHKRIYWADPKIQLGEPTAQIKPSDKSKKVIMAKVRKIGGIDFRIVKLIGLFLDDFGIKELTIGDNFINIKYSSSADIHGALNDAFGFFSVNHIQQVS